MFKKLGLMMFATLLVGITGVEAMAQAVPGEPLDTPLTFNGGVSGTFGAASLVAENPGTQTDYFLLSTSFGANYQFTDSLGLSVGSGYSQYLSEGGGINSQFEGRVQDTRLGLSLFPLYVEMETLGIIVSGGLGATLPTSTVSRAEGLIARVSPSVTLIKPFGGAVLVWSTSFTKNFHRFTSRALDINELDIIARDGGAEDLGQSLVAIDGVLPSFSWGNFFLLLYNIRGTGVQVRTSLSYSNTWTYDNGTITNDDEFTNPNAVPGRGHRQGVSGSFGMRYLLTGTSFFGRALVASASVNTAGTPLTSNNRGTRFPFWDFENGIASRTSFNLGLSGTY